MVWQLDIYHQVVQRLPRSVSHRVVGSTATPEQLDGWSDLDLRLEIRAPGEPVDLLDHLEVWALEEARPTPEVQVLRLVLQDGRRIDVVVEGQGRVLVPSAAADNDVRFVAALAAAKLARGDQLIGLHLTLKLLRCCLEQAMLLRDRDVGSNAHRFGTPRDSLAAEVADLLALGLAVTPRPNVVERAVELYGCWRSELESDYEPNWSGLHALLERGLGQPPPALEG